MKRFLSKNCKKYQDFTWKLSLSLFRRPLTRGAPGRGPGSPYVKAGSVCSGTGHLMGKNTQEVKKNVSK